MTSESARCPVAVPRNARKRWLGTGMLDTADMERVVTRLRERRCAGCGGRAQRKRCHAAQRPALAPVPDTPNGPGSGSLLPPVPDTPNGPGSGSLLPPVPDTPNGPGSGPVPLPPLMPDTPNSAELIPAPAPEPPAFFTTLASGSAPVPAFDVELVPWTSALMKRRAIELVAPASTGPTASPTTPTEIELDEEPTSSRVQPTLLLVVVTSTVSASQEQTMSCIPTPYVPLGVTHYGAAAVTGKASARALARAHAQRLLHPANILLSPLGIAWPPVREHNCVRQHHAP